MILKTLITCLLLLLITSCISTRDITDNPVPMTDFVVGQVYQLKKPTYLWKGRLMERELADSEGTFVRGTTLAVRKVEVYRSPEIGTLTDVFAEVLSGEFRGETVKLTWISQLLKTGYTKRDPTMLEPVQRAPE